MQPIPLCSFSPFDVVDLILFVFSWVFGDLILNNYFWRQTKESVKDAYVLPGLLEQLVLVQFTDLEKQMYKEASTNGKEKTNSSLFGSTLPPSPCRPPLAFWSLVPQL